MRDAHAHGAIEAVWRIESARLVARLVRMVGDIGLAEELAQDALVAALERWPRDGVPANPGGWLMATAKNRALDQLRRGARLQRKHAELGRELQTQEAISVHEFALDAALEPDVGDDLLRLIFITCHPSLSTEARVALTLRLLGGLTTAEIARAFLVSEPTVAQRIVRARRELARTRIPFELPAADELAERLSSVLEVIYLIFNAGYTASSGEEWIRPSLCEEALRLGRILATLAPAEPEVHALVALMEIQASRFAARIGPDGEPVLLDDQDRSRWDRLLAKRGLEALDRSRALENLPGPYALQAEIAACHARAATPQQTDWPRIAALYGALVAIAPSPVIELNRAVAVARASGPQAGLEIVDALAGEPALDGYHLFASVRGDLLTRVGRVQEARGELERGASLAQNPRERRLLLDRAQACLRSVSPSSDAAPAGPS